MLREVLRTELRALLRDRRAFFLAVVLPMLLFPALFLGMDELEQASRESLRGRSIRVVYDLDELAPASAESVLARLARPELALELVAEELADQVAARAPLERTGEERARLVLFARAPDEDEALPHLLLLFEGSSSLGAEARGRVGGLLRALADELELQRVTELLGGDPGAPFEVAALDVAPAEDTLGHRLGGLLPLVLVMILVSGASFAALGAFAGEREEGTLETLLVQPVPALTLAGGKFLAVLLTGCVAMLGNGASFLASIALGLGEARGLESELALGAGALRLALGLLLFLPTAVLLAAVLSFVSARAKSFREGQHYVFPVLLIGALLASASTTDRVTSTTLLALVPVTGPTLVVRDALAGSLAFGPAALSTLSSMGWAWLLLRRLAGTLDAERILSGESVAAEAAARRETSTAALRWGFAALFVVYVVGGRVQTAAPIPGLIFTLWGLALGLALLAGRDIARRTGQSFERTLGLGAPSPVHLVGALLLAPGLAVLVQGVAQLQGRVLPMPVGFEDGSLFAPFEALSPVALVLLVAVSPGICEELLFRGALLAGLKRDLPDWKVCLWQVALFGAVHASIYRFLPTGLVGGVLALVTLRTGRVWPAIVLHATYNAVLVLELPSTAYWSTPGVLAVGAIGAVLVLRWRA